MAQGLCFSGYAEARAVLLSCLMDPCSPDPLRWHFCLSGHQCYFKGKHLSCFQAQAGSAKLNPSNHSRGIYFCPPDFPSHFLGLFVWFLLGVMEHDKNREESQTWAFYPEKFTAKFNTKLRKPRQGLSARAGCLMCLGAIHGAWVNTTH